MNDITPERTANGELLSRIKETKYYERLSGTEFNKLFANIVFLKMLRSDLVAYGGYQYKIGMNIDTNLLSDMDRSSGGLHFFDVTQYPRYHGWDSHMCTVTIPSDAEVIVYSSTYKSTKIYIKDFYPKREHPILSSKYFIEPSSDLVNNYGFYILKNKDISALHPSLPRIAVLSIHQYVAIYDSLYANKLKDAMMKIYPNIQF